MSKISEFAAKQNEHNDKIDKAIEGISGDISFLKATIEKLQNTPGDVTADDQALLDALETRVNATTEKLAAIDDLTPPVAPTA
ncbi:MAG TPA: hypothetical protein VNT76_00915 [Candidatus Binatus sp.]|nr:hypothetical protein [Candidatus Binatus sp.]